jgi:hypothetical protein
VRCAWRLCAIGICLVETLHACDAAAVEADLLDALAALHRIEQAKRDALQLS